MVTEFVLYVVLINAQRSLPVITKGVEVSFDLFFFFFLDISEWMDRGLVGSV